MLQISKVVRDALLCHVVYSSSCRYDAACDMGHYLYTMTAINCLQLLTVTGRVATCGIRTLTKYMNSAIKALFIELKAEHRKTSQAN